MDVFVYLYMVLRLKVIKYQILGFYWKTLTSFILP